MYRRVIIVENDNSVTEKISSAIRETADFEIVATFDNIGAALGQSAVFRPDLFLIDVDEKENRDVIPAFVDIFPKTFIMCMLSKWDSQISEDCIVYGASGCMLKSFNVEELKENIALYTKRGKTEISKTFAFFSPKGRSGKTTFIIMLALALAEKSGESVAIIDADLQFGDTAIFFDIEPAHTVIEAARDISVLSPISLNPYFQPITDNLKLLCSPTRPEYAELVDNEKLTEVVRMASSLYRYILVDLPFGLSALTVSMCEAVDTTVMLAMMNTGLEVQHVKKALSIFQGWTNYGKKMHVVFSRVNPCEESERLKIAKEIGRPVSMILPNDYRIVYKANRGRMIDSFNSDNKIADKINIFADAIIQDKQDELDLR